MSSPRPIRIALAPRARQDFEDILRYTAETWGQPQMPVYRDKIDEAPQAISRNPQLGLRRADLPPTHLANLVGSHIIICCLADDKLGVVRILHERMSLPRCV